MTPSQTLMFALTLAQVAASGYVLYACSMVLNAMSKDTRHAVRWTYLALTAAAFTGVVCEASVTGCVYAIGGALYLAVNERRGHAPERKSIP